MTRAMLSLGQKIIRRGWQEGLPKAIQFSITHPLPVFPKDPVHHDLFPESCEKDQMRVTGERISPLCIDLLTFLYKPNAIINIHIVWNTVPIVYANTSFYDSRYHQTDSGFVSFGGYSFQ